MGTESSSYDYGFWAAVLVNTAFVLGFVAAFLAPVRKREWRSLGVVSAFVVALFTEMYGFPLTIYVLTSVLGVRLPVSNPFAHQSGHLWASAVFGPQLTAVFCTLGSVLMLAGLVLIGAGWRQIHRAGGRLVTSGLYARVRHPQYLGLFLLTFGMLVQWPTLPTLIMWPVLVATYVRLARREEREALERFGKAYAEYLRTTPAFWPKLLPARSYRTQEV